MTQLRDWKPDFDEDARAKEAAMWWKAQAFLILDERDRLLDALREIVEHVDNSGRGCATVDSRILDRIEETAKAAMEGLAE